MGGTDDDSNIVQLTIDEHANAHKELYEKFGLKEDYIAWKSLSGQFSDQERLYELASLRW